MDNGKQMRFTPAELALIQATFKDNDQLLRLLRKVFLPEYDPKAPLGQTVDLWMTIDVRSLNPDQAYIRLLARNELITHVEQQLIQLQFLTSIKVETPEEKQEKSKKNSTK